jgi:c-di-GMP-binding flagellar brake protein YcgR
MSEESQGGRERRVQRRISVGLPILVRGSDAGGRYEDAVHSFDLSRTGLSFATGREIAVGNEVEIVIPASGAVRRPEKEFCTLAQVVRVQNGEAEGERIVGVQFLGQRLNRVFVSEG